MREYISVIALLGVVLNAPYARSQDVPSEDAIRYRKAVMVATKWHFDRLMKHVRGTRPLSPEEVERSASTINLLGRAMSEGFVPGSQEGDTRAKSGIWEDAARFRRLGEQFQTESARVIERSRQGDPALLKAQLDAMGKACKACHDDFKKS